MGEGSSGTGEGSDRRRGETGGARAPSFALSKAPVCRERVEGLRRRRCRSNVFHRTIVHADRIGIVESDETAERPMLSRGRARLALAHSVAPRHHRHGDPRLSRRATDLVRENASALLRVHLATRRARTRVSRARPPPRVRERRSRGHVIARLLVRLGRRARQARTPPRRRRDVSRMRRLPRRARRGGARAGDAREPRARGRPRPRETQRQVANGVHHSRRRPLRAQARKRHGRRGGGRHLPVLRRAREHSERNQAQRSSPARARVAGARRATEPARFEPAPPSRPSRAAFTSTLTPHTPDSRTNPSGYRWWRGAQG